MAKKQPGLVELPADQVADQAGTQDAAPDDGAALIAAENERLRAQIAALLAGRTAPVTAASLPDGPARKYRVKRPGVRVRVVDEHGRHGYRDYLDVTARNEYEALQRFDEYSGIISSQMKPEVGLVPEELPAE